MNDKRAYFEARKADSGFHVSGSDSWSATCAVRISGCADPHIDPDVYAEWKWDGSKLMVRTCLTGVIPLYCYCTADRIVVSPCLHVLLSRGVPVEIDDDAMSVFLRFGLFINNYTPFTDIKVIGPNADFTWPEETDPPTTYPVYQASASWTHGQARKAYLELFHDSMARRLPPVPDFRMPLSGGLDSRHIFLELMHFNVKPELCYTAHMFPRWNNEDSDIAEKIAQKFKVEHVAVPCPSSRVESEKRKNMLTDFCSDEHSWAMSIHDFLAGGCSTVYDGINGGLMFGRVGNRKESFSLALAGRYHELAEFLLSKPTIPEIWFKVVLNEEYQKRWSKEKAVDVLRKELERFADCSNPVQAFYFWNRLRRETSCFTFGILGGHNVICPFLDRQLVEFALGLPVEISSYAGFQEEALKEGFPGALESEIKSKWVRRRKISKGYIRRYAFDLLAYSYKNRFSGIIDVGRIMRQSCRTLLGGKPLSLDWIAPEASIYVLQLEDILKRSRQTQS